ncbi:MAG: sigma-70 family RNA polymerase sigma factor [Polyangiaceae bacterium]
MDDASLELAFREHRGRIWAVCYRLTGDAAESDDLVQDTFRRTLEQPPPDTSRSIGPWLTQVATRLGIDALRRRKARGYRGPWLPTPVEDESHEPAELSTEARYGQRESATYAFLLALEVLSPEQRAVLVLRDVLDLSARETAEIAGLSEANVRVIHHRARKAMEPYDAERCLVDDALLQRNAQALEALGAALATGDLTQIAQLMCADAVSLNDANGEFLAAGSPVRGADKIAKFYAHVHALRANDTDARFRAAQVNGLPALIAEYPNATERLAPKAVFRLDVRADGLVHTIHVIAATGKLGHVRW